MLGDSSFISMAWPNREREAERKYVYGVHVDILHTYVYLSAKCNA